MRRPRATMVTSALLAWLAGRPAMAATEPGAAASVRWDAPAGCPSEATVRDRLARALGPEVEAPQVEAEVSAGDDGRFHATVVLRGTWGETTRRLDSPTCDTLADAVVLLTVVSVSRASDEPAIAAPAVPEPEPEPREPDATIAGEDDERAELARPALAPIEPAPATPVQPEPAPIEPVRRADARSSREPAAPSLRGLARIEARAGAGMLPTVDLGGAASLGLAHRWFRVELGGAGWLPRERTVAPDARVRVTAWALELRGCAALRPTAWLVVLPCAGLEAGRLRGEGRGGALAVSRTSVQPWLALDVGPALSFRLHRLVGVWLGATAVVPLRRIGFAVDGVSGVAHGVAPLAGRGALGLEIHFP